MSATPAPILLENLTWATVNHEGHLITVPDGALVLWGDRIHWIGKRNETPVLPPTDAPLRRCDLRGALVTPGLVDCHTHMAFAGSRANEFERRLAGETYASIARSGGGIKSTVRSTRETPQNELVRVTEQRLGQWLSGGVTTVEIKSGYGLDLETELRLLQAIEDCRSRFPGTLRATFLGAHSLPPDWGGSRGDYVNLVSQVMIPEVARRGLAHAVDVFCEHVGFTLEETEEIFRAAQEHGLAIKIHAEQLSHTGAAVLAASYGALSCDHLEHLDDAGVARLKESGTVAVLLPGSYYMLRETQLPPIAQLRAAGVPMAVATDFNPGTSPVRSLLMAANMACVLFGLTVAEAFAGITLQGARALGLFNAADSTEPNARGILVAGGRADLALWQAPSVADLIYEIGSSPCLGAFTGGVWRAAHASPTDTLEVLSSL